MKTQKKASSINLPLWMDMAVRDLAQKHKRSISGEIEFLVEEAIKNAMPDDYAQIAAPGGAEKEAVNA
jgi:hypothetical protein